jgi:hypothetical protein
MTIIELIRTFTWSRYDELDNERIVWVNHSPGIYYASFVGDFGLTDEAYWIPDPATEAVNYVKEVRVDNTTSLTAKTSIAALAAEPSFYWDNDEKLLYIRLTDFDPPCVHDIAPGLIQGFSDRGVVYIDDLYYAPLLVSSPRLGIKQDLQGETKPSFFKGMRRARPRGPTWSTGRRCTWRTTVSGCNGQSYV